MKPHDSLINDRVTHFCALCDCAAHPLLSQIPTGSRTLPKGSPTYLPQHWPAFLSAWMLCYTAGRRPPCMNGAKMRKEGRDRGRKGGRNERSNYAKRTSSSWSIYCGRRGGGRRRGQMVTPPPERIAKQQFYGCGGRGCLQFSTPKKNSTCC